MRLFFPGRRKKKMKKKLFTSQCNVASELEDLPLKEQPCSKRCRGGEEALRGRKGYYYYINKKERKKEIIATPNHIFKGGILYID